MRYIILYYVRKRTKGSERMYRDPVGHRIKTLNNLMRRMMDKVFGHKPDKATLMHSWIIGFIKDREEQGLDTFQKDIEKEFSINRSTTSEMINLMCRKGMVKRVNVSYDARLKKIVLTDQSRTFQQQIENQMRYIHDLLVKGLTEEEIDTFIMLADKLIDNVKSEL